MAGLTYNVSLTDVTCSTSTQTVLGVISSPTHQNVQGWRFQGCLDGVVSTDPSIHIGIYLCTGTPAASSNTVTPQERSITGTTIQTSILVPSFSTAPTLSSLPVAELWLPAAFSWDWAAGDLFFKGGSQYALVINIKAAGGTRVCHSSFVGGE